MFKKPVYVKEVAELQKRLNARVVILIVVGAPRNVDTVEVASAIPPEDVPNIAPLLRTLARDYDHFESGN